MFKKSGALLVGMLLTGLLGQAQAQSQGIYSCVDSKGRRLTADRPIAECADREQRVLNPSGTVKGTVGPSLTAHERAELEARQKLEAEEHARQVEEKRRERALLVRYPNKETHDKERAEAVAQIGVVRKAAVTRVNELLRQREGLATEMEFYKKDPAKIPPSLRRQVDDIAHSLEVQGRFIADQDAEIARVNARFDEELVALKQLWAQRAPRAATASGRQR
jgi:type I site-specific restriction endonuclease